MNVFKTTIADVVIIEPRIFEDARGYFFESFSQREFDEKVAPILGHKVNFVQDNESMSSYGVMRGLHFQRPPYTQSKLVRCVKGSVLDVAVYLYEIILKRSICLSIHYGITSVSYATSKECWRSPLGKVQTLLN